MPRFCKRFYCEERGDRFCCADCYLRKDCAWPCLNHPVRCGLEDPDGKPSHRRGKNARLRPKELYRRK